MVWWADNAYIIADSADALADMAADPETQLAALGLRCGAASLEAMGNPLALTVRNDATPFALPSGMTVPIVPNFIPLGVDIAFPSAVDRAEGHRRQRAFAAF